MSEAPTEKHLEDWIVDNLWRFGDSWEEDMYHPSMGDVYQSPDGTFILPFSEDIVARQFRIPSGIPDLITFDGGQVSVVEIKKGPVTYRSIGQCLRYIHDLLEVFYWTYADTRSFPDEDRRTFEYPRFKHNEITEHPENEVIGMVVGHGIEDSNIPIVCAACNIKVVTYEYHEGVYSFTHLPLNRSPQQQYRDLVDTQIGRYLRLTMQHYTLLHKQQNDGNDPFEAVDNE